MAWNDLDPYAQVGAVVQTRLDIWCYRQERYKDALPELEYIPPRYVPIKPTEETTDG
jgi:hypothetical protein